MIIAWLFTIDPYGSNKHEEKIKFKGEKNYKVEMGLGRQDITLP